MQINAFQDSLSKADTLRRLVTSNEPLLTKQHTTENETHVRNHVENQILTAIEDLLGVVEALRREVFYRSATDSNMAFQRYGEGLLQAWEGEWQKASKYVKHIKGFLEPEAEQPGLIETMDANQLKAYFYPFVIKRIGKPFRHAKNQVPAFTYRELLEYYGFAIRFVLVSLKAQLAHLQPKKFPAEDYKVTDLFFKLFAKQQKLNVDDVFVSKNPEIIQACFRILIDPPICAVDENLQFHGNVEKGVFAIWLHELQNPDNGPLIRHLSSRKAKVFLEQRFFPLTLNESNLQAERLLQHAKAEKKYGAIIRKKVSAVSAELKKLSAERR